MKRDLNSFRDTSEPVDFRSELLLEPPGDPTAAPNSEPVGASLFNVSETSGASSDTADVREQAATDSETTEQHVDAANAAEQAKPPLFKIDPSIHKINTVIKGLADRLNSTGKFFHKDGKLVLVEADKKPQIVTKATFDPFVHHIAEFQLQHGDVATFAFPPSRTVGAFVNSPTVARQHFREILYYTRMPTVVNGFRIVSEPGYDADSKTYYAGPRVTPSDDRTALDELLGTFLWKRPEGGVNYVGWLLTLVSMPLWPGRHPFAVFNANRPQLGKSTLARVAGILVSGEQPRTIGYTANDDELEKRVATIVREGETVIVLDNAKRGRAGVITSAVLERLITDRRVNFRRLGTNSSISAVNHLAVMVTMNEARFGPDLMQRSLPINLYLADDPRDHEFAHANIEDFVIDHREEVLAALLGMVQSWNDAGRPPALHPARHTVSQEWAATIDAILRHAGYPGFLANFETAQREFDPDYQALRELLAARDNECRTPSEWVTRIKDQIPESSIAAAIEKMPTRGKATYVGSLLMRLQNRTIEDGGVAYRLTTTEPTGHRSRAYILQPVEQRLATENGKGS